MGTEENLLTDVEAAMEKKKEAREKSKRTVEMVDLASRYYSSGRVGKQ